MIRVRSVRLLLAMLCSAAVAAGFAGLIAAAHADSGGPSFVQKTTGFAGSGNLTLTPTSNVTTGNRIIVQAVVWSANKATTSSVTDSAGNQYVELTHFTASDNTEMSVWTAPITAGGGTRPTITIKPSSPAASVGGAMLEYSGLSSASDATVVDQQAHAAGTTGSANASVASGATAATTANGELAIGFYGDSGFGDTLTAGSGYTQRVNIGQTTAAMEQLIEDQVVNSGATPNAVVTTGPKTPWMMATVVFKAGTSGPPTVPSAPTSVSATPGNQSATVSWTAPSNGGSAITNYTVTPYIGSNAQAPTTVPGSSNSATIASLTNGTTYTFVVSATNAVGTGPGSAPSNAVTPSIQPVTPAFVQKNSGFASATSLGVTFPSNITTGNRVVVQTVVWNASGASVSGVTDSAGNQYVELLHSTAPDNTEMTIWTAPITAGGGTRPTITVKATSSAAIGAVALEYSGLSTVGNATAADVMSNASGLTGTGSTTVSSGATAATTAGNELAVGFYGDSGFGDTVTSATGYTQRVNTSPTSTAMDQMVEDQVVGAGAKPNASAGTGAKTPWLMDTVVFKAAPSGPPQAPSAPTGVSATPGNQSATVNWTAPSDGGSPITSYTVTPYVGSNAQNPTTVPGSSTSATVNSLTNGTTYTFHVSATNAVGTGPDSAPSNAVVPSTSPGGQWGSLMNWSFVGIHSVLMNNGKVLLWDGWAQPEPTQEWDPSTQTFSHTQNAPDSIFCSGIAQLPDGRILVVGGYGAATTGNIGIVDTTIYDPTTSSWTRVADMHQPRWYPTITELPDGRYVVISGNNTDASHWADTPEVYNPTTNTWTNINVSTSQVHELEYPFSYLVPNGDVFTIGPSEDKSFLLDVNAQTWTQVGGSSGVTNGSSVMYRPGKILYSGGADSVSQVTDAQNNTAVIDLNSPNPTWQQTQPMAYSRIFHTLTMLADGTVLAVGGETTSGSPDGSSEVSGGILPSEIWNPDTQTWTTVASTAVTRGYHSTAILLPDGRVLVAGSGHSGGLSYPAQNSAQIYSPPYLFNGARPTITSAPASTSYGANFTLSTPDASSIKAVNLVSLGADTHQMDSQHFVPLNFTAGSGTLSVSAPSSGTYAPPGEYMVFIVNQNGVPSVASIIKVTPPPTAPSAPTGVTATPANQGATVSWTAPADGGSPITSYTVTPFIGSAAQTPTTVPGSSSSATIGSLTNGTTYTFQVSATNAVGTGPNSAPSNAVTPSNAPPPPSLIQKVTGFITGPSLALTPTANVSTGDRIVVESVVWSSNNATTSSVTDSAGNQYVELTHFIASDKTEMSIWTAPVTNGGGTRPTITVKPSTATAGVGAVALEYSGLSTVADATVVDQQSHATGTTGTSGATVASGATAATTAGNELAVGFYGDSGFGVTVTPGSGFTQRVNTSPTTSQMTEMVEDQVVGSGATPNATAGTGAKTPWLMATVVFKSQSGSGGTGASAGASALVGGATADLVAGGNTAAADTVPDTVRAAVTHSTVTTSAAVDTFGAAVTGALRGQPLPVTAAHAKSHAKRHHKQVKKHMKRHRKHAARHVKRRHKVQLHKFGGQASAAGTSSAKLVSTGTIKGAAAETPRTIAGLAACKVSDGVRGSWKCRQLKTIEQIFARALNWSGTELHYFCRYGLAKVEFSKPDPPQ